MPKKYDTTRPVAPKDYLMNIEFKEKFYPVDTKGFVHYKNQLVHIDVWREMVEGKPKKKVETIAEKTKRLDAEIIKEGKRLENTLKKRGHAKNAWVQFVKDEAKRRGISYPCAMTLPAVKFRWQKIKLSLGILT